MKKLFTIVLAVFIVSMAMAQSDSTNAIKSKLTTNVGDSVYLHLPDAKDKQPLYIINSNIIGGLSYLNPNDIASLTVLKGRDIPANLANLGRFGLVSITLKKGVKFETNTFNDIKKKFAIKGKVRFAVDGYFVSDESLLLSAKDINEINVTWKKNKDTLFDVTVNVWMLEPEARKGIIYKSNPNDKPGTIRIR